MFLKILIIITTYGMIKFHFYASDTTKLKNPIIKENLTTVSPNNFPSLIVLAESSHIRRTCCRFIICKYGRIKRMYCKIHLMRNAKWLH